MFSNALCFFFPGSWWSVSVRTFSQWICLIIKLRTKALKSCSEELIRPCTVGMLLQEHPRHPFNNALKIQIAVFVQINVINTGLGHQAERAFVQWIKEMKWHWASRSCSWPPSQPAALMKPPPQRLGTSGFILSDELFCCCYCSTWIGVQFPLNSVHLILQLTKDSSHFLFQVLIACSVLKIYELLNHFALAGNCVRRVYFGASVCFQHV